MLESIAALTWSGAFAIVASFTVIAGTILKLFKPTTDPSLKEFEEKLSDVSARLSKLETKFDHFAGQHIDFKEAVSALNRKIEKSNDLIIEVIRTTNSY